MTNINETITVYTVGPKDCNQCTELSIQDALNTAEGFMTDAEIGEIIEITIGQMTQEEIDNMTEYTGP